MELACKVLGREKLLTVRRCPPCCGAGEPDVDVSFFNSTAIDGPAPHDYGTPLPRYSMLFNHASSSSFTDDFDPDAMVNLKDLRYGESKAPMFSSL